MRDRHGYNPPLPGRLAARHTLIAEFIVGVQMMTLGYSGQTGGDGTGILHVVLERLGLDDTFGYYFLFAGLFMLQAATIEFLWGKSWSDDAIFRMAGFRKLAALGSAFGWLILMYLQLTTPLNTFKSLIIQAPVYLAVSLYFLWETRRVEYYTSTWQTTLV